ncbi:TRAP transporter small permease [Ramlibacter sp. XY19]|uniref:TRAP transporter small permease n=1 Tax=Ramlibacter paludis TaxID=2908000 RepID=UPI0023DC3874|nr:TRAP transporter small permease [Ramlibacter paludis]MCG2592475.1 TRAP transporter small permease [Ramlibacter paludis]
MRVLERLAKFCAILAGFLLTGITLMTCASLVGRNTTGTTLVGDFELTGVVAGAAIALFLPWCQVRRGNIIVDFFTARVGARANAALDRFGALLLGLSLALLAWRAGYGGMSAWRAQSTSMMLGFPEWIVYAAMVPPLVLTALIGIWQACFGFPEVEE